MINQAIMFATKAHEGQVRKVSESAFIIHPLAVGCMLADAGESEAVVVAGMLHDTVEDTDVTLDEIRIEFGDEVAEIVAGCSEDKSLSWEERKRNTIDLLETASEEVCIVTCADKIHNVQVSVDGIKEQGEDFFVHFKRGYAEQKWYYGTIKNVLLRRIPEHPLVHMYAEVFGSAFGKYE